VGEREERMGKEEEKEETYGGVALGWLVRPLRVPDGAVEPLHVD
jgi:hypothetical protein